MHPNSSYAVGMRQPILQLTTIQGLLLRATPVFVDEAANFALALLVRKYRHLKNGENKGVLIGINY